METLLNAGLSNAVSATFLAVLVACLGRALARRPALLHCLWMIVLLKLVTPPLYEVPIPWPQAHEVKADPEPRPAMMALADRHVELPESYLFPIPEPSFAPEFAVGEIALAPSLDEDGLADFNIVFSPPPAGWPWNDALGNLALVWLSGTAVTVVISMVRIGRFQRVLRQTHPADLDTQEWIHDLAMGLGLRRSPTVLWISGPFSPLIWPVGLRAKLIIPSELWKRLDDRQRKTLVVHELAHLRRGDHFVRIFELVVTALYWWNPVLWWARQAMRDVEEQCCDAWVVWAFPEAAKSYAETLLETVDFLNQSPCAEPLLASGFGKVNHLRKRLTMIMSGTTPRRVGVRGALGSLSLAGLLLPLNATWAQQPEKQQEVRVVVVGTEDSVTQDVKFESGEAQIVIKNDVKTDVAAKPETVTLEFDEPQSVVTELSRTVNDGKPDVIHLDIKTDGVSTTVDADSIEQAVERITRLLEKQSNKKDPTSQETAQREALKRALAELKKATAADQVLDKTRRLVINRRLDAIADDELGKEKKAEIEAARAKVKEIAQSLQAKQKELAEARVKLSKLEGSRNTATAIVRALPRATFQVSPATPATPVTPKAAYTLRSLANVGGDGSSAKRLEELEKKLDKLLEEVATLKKDRSK